MDKDLTYETQCSKVLGLCYEKLGALSGLTNLIPQSQMCQLVEALIISALDWCAELWLRNKKNQVKVQSDTPIPLELRLGTRACQFIFYFLMKKFDPQGV